VNPLASLLFVANAAALLMLPPRWAALPLLVGACYMPFGPGMELGPLHFPVLRLLIAVGVLRVLLRGERPAGGINGLDRLMLLWAAWAIGSSVLHQDVAATFVNRLGLAYNACGIYFLLRVFCRSPDDVVGLCRITAILLLPLALALLSEQSTGRNLFAALGGADPVSELRGGVIRAQGPFSHPILAGSVGATCLPLMFALWRRQRVIAIAGMAACMAIVHASASSGPILSAAFGLGALALWSWRRHMRLLRWLAVLAYVLLDFAMQAPAYYLIARVDLTGSSTSWHRSELIRAAVRHFPDWWLAGTDYTRHWLSTGVGWSANHIDVTNYYIMMGVYGGLALLLLFIAVLAKGFAMVGQTVHAGTGPAERFVMWSLGAALFAHAATFVSVSYFDQSFLFLYLTLAAICAGRRAIQPLDSEPTRELAQGEKRSPEVFARLAE
jgi:hypothetical protein